MRAAVLLALALFPEACAAPPIDPAIPPPRPALITAPGDPPSVLLVPRMAAEDGGYRYLPPRRQGVPSWGLSGARARVPRYQPPAPSKPTPD